MSSNYGDTPLEDTSPDAYFRKALTLMERIETTDLQPVSREFRLLHAEALRVLTKLQDQVETLGLFSPNESVEDVNTKELKYMNVNFYIAKLIEKTPLDPSRTSADARISLAQLSARKYFEFIMLLNQYGIPHEDEKTAEAHSKSLERVFPHGVRGGFRLGQLESRRGDRKSRIEAYQHLTEAQKLYDSSQKSVVSPADEEHVRAAEIARLQFHHASAWEAALGLADELRLLTSAASAFSANPLQEQEIPYLPSPYIAGEVFDKITQRGGPTFDALRTRLEATAPPDMSTKVEQIPDGKVLGPRGEVRSPFVILPSGERRRTDVARGVFGTGQQLPTMTMQELVEKELANQVRPEIPKSQKEEEDEDRDDIADKLTMKARKWDDFTEDNPRGSGNTLNLG